LGRSVLRHGFARWRSLRWRPLRVRPNAHRLVRSAFPPAVSQPQTVLHPARVCVYGHGVGLRIEPTSYHLVEFTDRSVQWQMGVEVERKRKPFRRRAAAVLLPATAGIIGLTLGAKPAGATVLEREDIFTFSNGTADVTCFIKSYHQFPRLSGDPDRAFAMTRVEGSGACLDSNAIIRFDYREPDGTEHVDIQAGGSGGFVSAEVEPVAEVTTKHLVSFGGCVGTCTTPIYVLGPTSK